MRKLFLLALAATALFSCSKENETDGPQSAESRTVVVKFAPAALSRATEAPVSGAATVSNYTIFFLDENSKVVLGTKSGDTPSGPVACTAVAATAKTVYVVANANDLLTTLADIKTLADIQALTKKVETQTDIKTVVMNNAASVSENGKITGTDTYAAAVTLAPALARIEIAGVKCTTAGKDFTVKAIYIDRYATTFTVGGGYDNSITDASTNVTEGIFNIGKDDSQLPKASNRFADVADVAAVSGVAAPADNEIWAYQLAAGAPLPKIIVKLENISDVADTRYVTVSNYKKSDGTTYADLIKAGAVYQISNIEFEATTDLPELPNASAKDVSVTVTIKSWEGIPLTPGI